jgi:predicted methyltransferase
MTARATAAASLAFLALATGPAAGTGSDLPPAIRSALADRDRPAAERAADAARQPGELLAFAGVGPGERVADFMSGGGYFTRLFSRAVGAGGRVYAFLPEEQLRNCKPEETAGTQALEHDAHYHNLTVLRAPVAQFHAPEPLDLVWTSLNFHDLYDSFMGPADVPRVMQALFAALKPEGVLLVVDHAAAAGSGTRDTETLHRIDPQAIVAAATAAGFRLEARSELLANRTDRHERRVFDPAIRWHTDQAVLKFRKPRCRALLCP